MFYTFMIVLLLTIYIGCIVSIFGRLATTFIYPHRSAVYAIKLLSRLTAYVPVVSQSGRGVWLRFWLKKGVSFLQVPYARAR